MNIQPLDIMAMASELFSKANIIKLPESTKYCFQDTLNVILHAATSVTNSLESASIDLKLKNPDKRIPSGDSIHDYINSNSIDYIISAFRNINSEIKNINNGIWFDSIDFTIFLYIFLKSCKYPKINDQYN